DEFGGAREITFILAILVVQDHDHAARAEIDQGLLHGREPGLVPLVAHRRLARIKLSRYRAIRSTSTLTPSPGLRPPSFVRASVSGIRATSKVRAPTAATVKETPWSATEPFSPINPRRGFGRAT